LPPKYISEPNEDNSASTIFAGMLADYQARMPVWVPNPGAPEVLLMQVESLRHSVLLNVFQQVKALIFAEFGISIGGVPFGVATSASADATVTIAEEYLGEANEVSAGFRVLIGEETFAVQDSVLVGVGTKSVTVTLVASEPGTAANGLTGAVTPLDTDPFIQSIALLEPTNGGEDQEDEDTYRDRLVAKERRDSPTIITAVDAQEAILEIPGVGGCLILDNYVPGKGEESAEEDVPGAFTAVLRAPDGSNVSDEIKALALAVVSLEGERLLDLDGHVIDPTRTDLAIEYAFDVFPGFDESVVKTAADAAVTAYLDDATWGSLPGAGGTQDWTDEQLVRFAEIYTVLNNVEGLNHVTSLKINGKANEDVALAGPGALPNLTSIKSGPTWDDATKTWDEITATWDDATMADVS
jgi:hypothetical protein